jgi:hypothetical protein
VAALASRCGVGPVREEETDGLVTLSTAPGTGRLVCHVVLPHLVLARSPGRVFAALLRPVGPGRCSVLSAVLRPATDRSDVGDGEVRLWREVLAAAAGG